MPYLAWGGGRVRSDTRKYTNCFVTFHEKVRHFDEKFRQSARTHAYPPFSHAKTAPGVPHRDVKRLAKAAPGRSEPQGDGSDKIGSG